MSRSAQTSHRTPRQRGGHRHDSRFRDGVSTTTVRKLLRNHRAGRSDPIEVRQTMIERLATEHGAAAYSKRKTTVETVFGNIKANLGFRRFSMRGLDATSSEWRLVCTVHNLLKIHRHRLAAT